MPEIAVVSHSYVLAVPILETRA